MTGAFPSPKEAADWILEVLSSSSLIYTVSLLRDDRPVTERYPIGILGQNKWGTLHYIFDPNFWGNGYCTEALLSYVPELWKWEPERRMVWAAVLEDNTASRRVLERCGFWVSSSGRGRVVVSAKIESRSELHEQKREEQERDEKRREGEEEEEDDGEEITQEQLDALKTFVNDLGLINKPAVEPVRTVGTKPGNNHGKLVGYRFDKVEEV
jgi:hypothetical protein